VKQENSMEQAGKLEVFISALWEAELQRMPDSLKERIKENESMRENIEGYWGKNTLRKKRKGEVREEKID
jgi:hypothetical protein